MDEQSLIQFLRHLLEGESLGDALDAAYDQPGISDDAADIEVQTFAEVQLLTGNKGLIVTMPDGSTFQLTVVQSRWNR